MIVQRPTLDSLLLRNVCEVRFVRRRPRAGDGPTRRMLCTKSYEILNSINGRTTLNYRPPSGPIQVNEARDNLIVGYINAGLQSNKHDVMRSHTRHPCKRLLGIL